MSVESDAELLRILARELALDGGVAELSVLPTYDPKIRRLLGDRKLWEFIRAYPRHFQCRERSAVEGSTKELTVRLLEPPPQPAPKAPVAEPPGGWRHRCDGCGSGFRSRNALFKHLRSDTSCPSAVHSRHGDASTSGKLLPGGGSRASRTANGAVDEPLAGLSTTGRALVQAIQGVLRGDRAAVASACGAVPLPWVVSPAKSRSALRLYVRHSGALAEAAAQCPPAMSDSDAPTGADEDDPESGSLQPFRPRWWLVAMRCLHTLLFSLPTLFELSIPAGRLLDSSELRACTIKERTQPKGTATNGSDVAASVVADTATAGSAVALRVVQLLEWHEIRSGLGTHEPRKRGAPVTLGVLARDKGLQKHLGSRQLLPLLQAQCCGGDDADTPPLVLLHEEKRGWCAQLRADHAGLAAPSPEPASVAHAPIGITGNEVDGADGAEQDVHSVENPGDDDADVGAAYVAKRSIPVLAVVPGAVVVNKPCGVSTEEVVQWLQDSPPAAVQAEMDDVTAQHSKDQQVRRDGTQGYGNDHSELDWRALDQVDPSGLHCDRSYTLETVSRLDKPTSGVLLIPLTRRATCLLTEQWRSRTVEKTYICLCSGKIEPAMGSFSARLRTLNRGKGSRTAPHPQGKEALTEYRRLRVYGIQQHPQPKVDESEEQTHLLELFSLCEVYPKTGRTHQIRAHFGAAGYPLVGDVKYGGPVLAGTNTIDRLFLHSSRLQFSCIDQHMPATSAEDSHGGGDDGVGSGSVRHDVKAALPLELQQVLAQLTIVETDTAHIETTK